ncbi:hypothetical protein AS9A_0824 [Hoyosella subflava DQS3-9A1]|uniref:Uncharacterized protein n=1 Tax=Hoyosella subflava (strain DSM 45089 / JCM 17490 / NBRC 109087 / DQS3-9A1) TaxID=443218 RepID=F6EM70_HOYSD|nr:hypothetical protein AS9A_0824 [Hoyosella subflava DQS3-9A1]
MGEPGLAFGRIQVIHRYGARSAIDDRVRMYVVKLIRRKRKSGLPER